MKRKISIFIFMGLGVVFFYFFISLKKNPDSLKIINYPEWIYLIRTECPCCIDWENYIKFQKLRIHTVVLKKSIDIENLRKTLAMPDAFYTCNHIAFYKGYILEGHLPVKALNYLDKTKPNNWIGITMKQKPPGAPGIGLESFKRPEAYEIFAVPKDKEPYPFIKIEF